MTTDPYSHSRRVAMYRRLALAMALALVAVVVFWSDTKSLFTKQLTSITADDTGVHIVGSLIRGTDDKGRPYTLRAETMVQSQPDANDPAQHITMQQPRLQLAAHRGNLRATGDSGVLEQAKDIATLRDNGHIIDDEGNDIAAPLIIFNTKSGDLEAQGPVKATGPSGTINAAHLIWQAEDDKQIFTDALMTLQPKGGQ